MSVTFTARVDVISHCFIFNSERNYRPLPRIRSKSNFSLKIELILSSSKDAWNRCISIPFHATDDYLT